MQFKDTCCFVKQKEIIIKFNYQSIVEEDRWKKQRI